MSVISAEDTSQGRFSSVLDRLQSLLENLSAQQVPRKDGTDSRFLSFNLDPDLMEKNW